MLTIFKKELSSFFSSITGYVVMIVFLLALGLFVWVFPDSNVLDYGYASLDPLFFYAPWIFIFLIPAITMKSFSDEIKTGTIELLSTRPVTDLQIVLGKYFASLFLVVFSVLPTLLYFYTINQLGNPKGNMDIGATWGSYIGLIFLSATFLSIGVFTSSITSNQIVAFILAVFLCFFSYQAFDMLSKLNFFAGTFDTIVQNIGINYHYQSISRGVVDTRDTLYFLSFITIFILMTRISLQSRKW